MDETALFALVLAEDYGNLGTCIVLPLSLIGSIKPIPGSIPEGI